MSLTRCGFGNLQHLTEHVHFSPTRRSVSATSLSAQQITLNRI
jgi:hypothetical protein